MTRNRIAPAGPAEVVASGRFVHKQEVGSPICGHRSSVVGYTEAIQPDV